MLGKLYYKVILKISFLNRCLYPDDGAQWSVSQLLKHSFINGAPVSTNSSVNGVMPDMSEADRDKLGQINQTGDDSIEFVREVPFLYANVIANTRVRREFEILQSLGKGGFGSVVKVVCTSIYCYLQ